MKAIRQNEIFKYKPAIKRSFFGWLFNRHIAENSVIELTNAIVDAGRPSAVSDAVIGKIHSRFRFNVYKRFPADIASVYLAFVRNVFSELADTELTQEDVDDITALQRIFQIPDEAVAQLNIKAGADIYRDALKVALADSVLSEKEKKTLKHLGHQLDLSEETIRSLYNKALADLIREKVEDALEDGVLSPDEEADIKETAKRFAINLSYAEDTERAIRQAKKIWQLKHDPLTPIAVDIQLQRDENCYAMFDALWLEVRRAAAMPWHPRYITMSDSSEIALSYAPIVEDCLAEIDAGQLFVTNKRLIFVGKSCTMTILYSKILRIEQFREGIKVYKGIGRSPYLVSNRALPLGTLVNRLFVESCKPLTEGREKRSFGELTKEEEKIREAFNELDAAIPLAVKLQREGGDTKGALNALREIVKAVLAVYTPKASYEFFQKRLVIEKALDKARLVYQRANLPSQTVACGMVAYIMTAKRLFASADNLTCKVEELRSPQNPLLLHNIETKETLEEDAKFEEALARNELAKANAAISETAIHNEATRLLKKMKLDVSLAEKILQVIKEPQDDPWKMFNAVMSVLS